MTTLIRETLAACEISLDLLASSLIDLRRAVDREDIYEIDELAEASVNALRELIDSVVTTGVAVRNTEFSLCWDTQSACQQFEQLLQHLRHINTSDSEPHQLIQQIEDCDRTFADCDRDLREHIRTAHDELLTTTKTDNEDRSQPD